MLFVRVNEYTVRCIIEETEIDQMGYKIDELYSNQDMASNFMKNVLDKAKEAGFQLAGSFQSIQAALMPDHKLVLNFVDINPEEQINFTISNFLTAYEAVEIVGKERLTEILALSGESKTKAFQEAMIAYQNVINQTPEKRSKDLRENQFEENVQASLQDDKNNVSENIKTQEQAKVLKDTRYVIRFNSFSDVSKFAKELSFQTNVSLYKEKDLYYLVADLEGLDEKAQNNLIFQAKEYAIDFQKNTIFETFLSEHGQLIINQARLDVLQKL